MKEQNLLKKRNFPKQSVPVIREVTSATISAEKGVEASIAFAPLIPPAIIGAGSLLGGIANALLG